MKVLFFSSLFPIPGEPTRGIYCLHTIEALRSYCETEAVVPLPWWHKAAVPIQSETSTHDVKGIRNSILPYKSIPGIPPLHALGMAASLRKQIDSIRSEFPFDIILAAWAYPDGVAAARLAQKINCPLVTMVLGSDINELPRYATLNRQIRWGLGHSERVVAVSEALRQRVIGLGVPSARVLTQHNGVDGSSFVLREKSEVRAKLELPQDRSLLCYIGNFRPEKGVMDLIDAVGLLSQAGRSDLELLLIGSGETEKQLRDRVRQLGIDRSVRFIGRKLHSEIPEWISACDLLCLPSHREGCPNVIIEALASGRPVLASGIGGVPELLNQDNGLMVPPGNTESLANGIQEALSQVWCPEKLRGSVEFLSWDHFGSALKAILEDALKEWQGCSRQPV